ncbi:12170_t:CDS:2 [Entrophospora sp. SA101]|nr:12170_t:CDS:2 [Entrophospora sp. SA101]CAJ0879022.1 3595_t:CDS:2 [Entrophospora sp. SA101]CAJ0913471.1 7701_t:CDS:2 [Entrophospora sp. SA101]
MTDDANETEQPLSETSQENAQENQEIITGKEISGIVKKKNIPPSNTWKHFEKIFDNNGIHLHSICNYCNQKYAAKCSTTTLTEHWKKIMKQFSQEKKNVYHSEQ